MGKYQGYDKYKYSGVEWLGEIPNHWTKGTLKRIAERVVVGIAEAATYAYVDEGVPILRATNVRENKIVGDILKVDTEYSEGRESKLIKSGDLITVRTGNAGVTALIPKELDKCQCFTMLITTLVNKVNNNFYCYFINSHLAKSYFSLEGWGTAQINISVPILKELPIVIPPLDEQEKIARFLDYKTKQIDELIAKKETLIEKLDEKRTSLISHAVTKGLDVNVPMKDSGIEWLGDIPEHWEVKRLKFVATVQPSNVDKKTLDDEIPVFLCNYSDVYNHDRITDEIEFMQATASQAEIRKFTINKGDVIITKDSENPNDIAVPALVTQDFDNVICGYHLTQIKQKDLDGNFLFRLFQCRRFNSQFIVSANGVTRFGLPQRAVNDAFVGFPPLEEQEKIARFLDYKTKQLEEQKTKIQQAIDLLKEYRTALITNAVTGKIDVSRITIPKI